MRYSRLAGAAIGALVGALIGAAEYALDVVGMHRAAQAPGLEGISVGFEWIGVFAAVTLGLMLLACGLLQLRLWALTAPTLFVVELAVVGWLWPHAHQLGLRGDRQALLFVVVTTAVYTYASVFWPRSHALDADR